MGSLNIPLGKWKHRSQPVVTFHWVNRKEIYIGGAGVARGYLKRPPADLGGVFLPIRFSDEPQARMYRSGDLGRVACQMESLSIKDATMIR